MADLDTLLPLRRPNLLLMPGVGDERYFLQDLDNGERFSLGEQEFFLLSQLADRQTVRDLCRAYEGHFGEPLSAEDVREFLDVARAFLAPIEAAPPRDLLAEEIADYERRFAHSLPLFERSRRVIAGSATHDRRNFGPFPVAVERAEGAYKWPVGGERLIDYWTGHGALLCGHSFPPVVEAVTRQMSRGTHYGAAHELEIRWAELVCKLVPSAERVRFTASGTEATLLALRIARAFTGRPRVLKFHGHFHGWHDEAMSHFYPAPNSGFSPGAVEHCVALDLSSFDEVGEQLSRGDVAAVLLEPGGGTSGALGYSRDRLLELREVTRRHGTLLLFDEVISGFRYSPGGVQELVGVLPDLTTLAKILSGGLPGGAVAGRADVMAVFGAGTSIDGRRAQVPHTGTFNGNPLSAAAGVALLERVADGTPQRQAQEAAARLVQGVNHSATTHGIDVALFADGTSIYHILIGANALGATIGPSTAVNRLYNSHSERYARLRRLLLLEGVDSPPLHGWLSAAHDDEAIDETVRAFDRAFARLSLDPLFRLPG